MYVYRNRHNQLYIFVLGVMNITHSIRLSLCFLCYYRQFNKL